MIRYLMKYTFKCKYNGCAGVEYYTIDGDPIKVETKLRSGGIDEESHERHELIGVEVLDENNN